MQLIQNPAPALLVTCAEPLTDADRRSRIALLDRFARLRRRFATDGRGDPTATPSSRALDSTGLRDRYR